MSELIAVVYQDENKAVQVLEALRNGPDGFASSSDLQDAVHGTMDSLGNVRLHRNDPVPLLRTLFMTPAFGAPDNASSHAAMEAVGRYGIHASFLSELAGQFRPGSSALFILCSYSPVTSIRGALVPYGGVILQTRLHIMSWEQGMPAAAEFTYVLGQPGTENTKPGNPSATR